VNLFTFLRNPSNSAPVVQARDAVQRVAVSVLSRGIGEGLEQRAL
jgi:hypothetical protein